MGRLAEILQAIVALCVIGGDIFLNVQHGPNAAYDALAAIVVGFYFGGKVAQTLVTTPPNGALQIYAPKVAPAQPASGASPAAGDVVTDPPTTDPAATE